MKGSVGRIVDLAGARRLSALGPSLPEFVSAAYSLFNRRLLAEALLDSWIVVEQVINSPWKTNYQSRARDPAHTRRLEAGRSFTANIRAEVLWATGVLEDDLYDLLQRARKHRNDLAHGANVSVAAAGEGMNAMRGILELVLGRTPALAYSPEYLTF